MTEAGIARHVPDRLPVIGAASGSSICPDQLAAVICKAQVRKVAPFHLVLRVNLPDSARIDLLVAATGDWTAPSRVCGPECLQLNTIRVVRRDRGGGQGLMKRGMTS